MSVSVQVECYSGYTYAQEPRAFEWGGQRHEVKRILKRWRTPQGPGFRVEVAGSANSQSTIPGLVDLAYLEVEDEWTLTVCT